MLSWNVSAKFPPVLKTICFHKQHGVGVSLLAKLNALTSYVFPYLPSFLSFFLSNSVGYTWPDVLKQCSKNVPQINIFAYFSWKGEKGERKRKPTSRAKTNGKSKSKQHNSNIFARVPLRHSYPHYISLVCFLSSPIPPWFIWGELRKSRVREMGVRTRTTGKQAAVFENLL